MAKHVQISAKVAAILSYNRIAVNIGTNEGIIEGDRVFVMRTEKVLDPDSGEVLGFVELIHLRLAVSEVQERLCVADVTEPAGGEEESVFTVALQTIRPTRKKRIAQTRISASNKDDPDLVPVEVGQKVIVVHPDRQPSG